MESWTHLSDLVDYTLPQVLAAPRAVFHCKAHDLGDALLACVEGAQVLEELEAGLKGVEGHCGHGGEVGGSVLEVDGCRLNSILMLGRRSMQARAGKYWSGVR